MPVFGIANIKSHQDTADYCTTQCCLEQRVCARAGARFLEQDEQLEDSDRGTQRRPDQDKLPLVFFEHRMENAFEFRWTQPLHRLAK